VRHGDAHSWVEVYVDGRGWLTFDPTPSAGAQPLDHGGFFGLMRDMFEAVSQGWDRYVVGYDLPTQVSLFHRIQRVMESARRHLSPDGSSSTLGSKKRWLYVGGGVLVVAVGIWLFVRRKKAPSKSEDRDAGKARQQRLATQLWLQLEEALQARGASRPRHVPPLRFAEQLRAERKDAVGDEAFALASRYALARFGNEEQREFERRVAMLRRGARGETRTEAS